MATATATPPLPTWDPAELAPLPVRRFTLAEYHELMRSGVLPDEPRHELLEGWIVPRMSKKPPHEVAIALTNEALRTALPAGFHIRIQSAMNMAESEPEPDLAVIRGSARDYLERHPGPADVGLVIEVADTSLASDRKLKARIYARAGLSQYWIVNLNERVVEVRTEPSGPVAQPSYGRTETVGPEGSIPLVLDGREVARVAVRDLLP